MTLKKLKEYLFDNEIDLKERLFTLVMTITLISWIISLIENIITGAELVSIIALAGGIAALTVAMSLSLKYNKIKIGSIVICIGICFGYVPLTFLFGGGLNGDGPLWFLFGIIFINLCLGKKAKIIFLLLYWVELKVLWTIDLKHPELIYPNTEQMAHVYSFIAMILIGLALSLVISIWNRIYEKEVQRSKKQKAEIESLNRAQNSFFSSMSHEIRTPINTIIGLNEMILREKISEEVAEDAVNIQSASKLLLSLINDILDMSKFASGQMQLTPVNYHPGDMLSEIVGMLWLKAKEKGLEFKVNVSPDIPDELFGDEVRIKQILINVLNNAIKYTKEGSVSLSIECNTVKEGTVNVIYTVTDTGIGIKKENIPFLFTAFKRVDEERNRHIEGTGLGLSIVKQFVDLMEGKITVNSVYTKGSTFIIEIPQKTAGDKLIGEIHIESQAPSRRYLTHSKRFEAPDARVLVVDDNASNLLVISKLLRETRVHVDTAASGEEALKKTLNTFYHVIFMDHLMPEMDGIECFKALRAQTGGLCKESKVIALTANAGSDNRDLYAEEGFDGYLSKPVTGDELERELYRILPKNMTFVTGNDIQILEETISWMKNDKKKKHVAITTESVADLPKEITDKYQIAVLPHLVCTAEGNFLDGEEIETNGLLDYMSDPSKKVTTKPPEVSDIESFFAKQLSVANNIIHISISSELVNSGCNAAKEAAKAFDNVTVIDSKHLSSAQGLLVIEACRLAEKGKGADEIIESIEGIKNKVHSDFIVDNLDFLARAGQVSAKTANIAKALMARPVLGLKKGKMGVNGFYLGSRERAWKKYINTVLKSPSRIDKKIAFVTYVGLSKQDMEWIRERIESKVKFEAIYFKKASPVIAVNCGPGTFGILTKDAERG